MTLLATEFRAIACDVLQIDRAGLYDDQIAITLLDSDEQPLVLHLHHNAAEHLISLTGLLGVEIDDSLPAEVLLAIGQAATEPLRAGYGLGILPETRHLVVFKLMPETLFTRERLREGLAELLRQAAMWNRTLARR
ncbi:MAG: hypothetical protein JO171_07695 [Paludibacterium sp.]|uniref:hypothetical protein n=1 Tax=Paludibacterium sp. TaxID=1917523 RepID=UPI0025F148D9|nr:hypothetical protein [Paludibacterium sp.]MBV8047017.1 hypothetical protein [Paludibacterium sp.]MBV8648183.1 hypothetical protein [Paludibacterium sp.]